MLVQNNWHLRVTGRSGYSWQDKVLARLYRGDVKASLSRRRGHARALPHHGPSTATAFCAYDYSAGVQVQRRILTILM
jgi:hypothetical protein